MSNQNHKGTSHQQELLKEAASALDLAQRRTDAEKLAFSMVERGKITSFQTHGEFQEKVAELMQKDLRVVEEALDMDASMADFGKVAAEGGQSDDAHSAFFHTLAEN
jgi:hypothetical protein